MDKKLKDAIMALPEMKERLKKLYAFTEETYKMPHEALAINIRLTTKTVANLKEDETSIAINNKLRELIEKPL